jgi:hypothetical protein
MSMTPQTETVVKALRALGIQRKNFSARVLKERKTYIDDNGQRHRYTEWGPSVALVNGREAKLLAAERAQELADQNLGVSVFRHACGHIGLVTVSSAWNFSKAVDRVSWAGACYDCREIS